MIGIGCNKIDNIRSGHNLILINQAASNSDMSLCEDFPETHLVHVKGNISAIFPECYYIVEPDRSSAVRVEGAPLANAGCDSYVELGGFITNLPNGERSVRADTQNVRPALNKKVHSLYKRQYSEICGTDSIRLKGSENDLGPNTVGSLITVCGAVEGISAGHIILKMEGGNVTVETPSHSTVQPGRHVTITGISTLKKIGERYLPKIRVRALQDIHINA